MSPRTWGHRALCAFAVALVAVAGSHAQERGADTPKPAVKKEAAPPAQFGAQAAAITVDVVVLDRDGRPLPGLTREEITILEDGRPQPIVGFEPRQLAPPPAAGAPAVQSADAVGLPQASGEEAAGRTMALVIDDLAMDGSSHRALEAIREWLITKADPRDAVTLFTTSGEVEWTGRVGSGRLEALHALARIRPRRPPSGFFITADANDPQPPPMTEWRAYQIATRRTGLPGPDGAQVEPTPAQQATANVIWGWWQGRARAIVGAVEEFSRDNAGQRGRKPVFVFTQGLIREDDLKLAERAIDAAQRANTPVYFLDTRGLVASGDVAGAGRGPRGRGDASTYGDVAQEAARHLDTAGAEQIAVETGGAMLRDSNDLLGSLTRAVDESSTYYLVGYQPAKSPDGKWHKVEVKVAVKDATVRARRGYYASAQPLSAIAEAATSVPQDPPAGAPPPSSAAPAPPSAEGEKPPAAGGVLTFSTRAEAITVDVVVLDKQGQPVTDLARSDFTLLEDGRAQEIVGFEPRTLAREAAAPEPPATEGMASNERATAPLGRTLAFVIDDLGIEPLRMADATKAIGRWFAAGSDPRDEVTLVTSSGDAWWSDTVGAGRADLEAVLARVKGKKVGAGSEAMSDWEAYSIDALGSPIDEPTGGNTAPPTSAGSCTTQAPSINVLERVVDRWLRSGACICDTASPETIQRSIRTCRGNAFARARQVYQAATLRAVGLLGTVERLSSGLAGARGRKSVIVLSQGLLRDTEQRAFERAVDASRRGNTAVSFVDVRGLIGLPLYGAEQTSAPKPADVGTLTTEITLLETAGGEYMAETTGGSTVRNTNDLAGSVKRLADEAAAYYLLGYQSDRPLDGRWRKLSVKVARPGLTVRARRGFFATSAAPSGAVESGKKKKKGKDGSLPARVIDPALAVGGERDQIPLRVAPHVLETDVSGTTRVLVAMEVGTTSLSFAGTGAERTAQLDVTVLGVSRDQPRTVPVDSHVALGVDARAVGGWYVFSRELRLPPGPAQIRAFVRDSATGRSGLVAQRVDIPSPGAPYISTPILGDRMLPAPGAGEPRLVVAARRSFPSRGLLYCAYEVYVAPGGELQKMPHVMGSYRLEDAEGRVVASAPPTPIAMALDARFVRMVGLPLDGLAPGRYRLTIQAVDKESGINLEARQAFAVEPPSQAAAKPD